MAHHNVFGRVLARLDDLGVTQSSGSRSELTPADRQRSERRQAILDQPPHRGLHRWLCDLNQRYRDEPALYARDFEDGGFTWLDPDDADLSVLSFLRHGPKPEDTLLVVLNFTPVPRSDYPLGVPQPGVWREILNSDATSYGGSGQGNLGECRATAHPYHRQPYSLRAHLPPLAALFFKRA